MTTKQLTIRFRLSEILVQKGYTARQLYLENKDTLKFNYTTLLRISRNETQGITLDVIGKLCAALDIQPAELFAVADEKTPPLAATSGGIEVPGTTPE